MSVGGYLSVAAHVGLLGWVVWNGEFTSEPLDVPVTEVSVISSEIFDVMANNTPPVVDAASSVMQAPVVPDAAPDMSSSQDQDVDLQDASQAAAPTQDALPTERPAPLVRPEDVVIVPPTTPVAPEIQNDLPVTTVANTRPKPRPAPRIAPQSVAPPPPDVDVGEVNRDAVEPDRQSDAVAEPAEATAPEEASSEIVTEAETPSAPERSARPQLRPDRPTPDTSDAGTVASAGETEVDPIAAALAEALEAATSVADAPTSALGEQDARALSMAALQGMQLAIEQCWNVGALSSDALQTIVKVGMVLTVEGRPIPDSFYLASSQGGTDGSVQQAYETARRAILKCGAQGFDLPVEHFEIWQYVEMTFNPEQMRTR